MNALADPIRTAALRRLWERMTAIYGHRWASAYGEAAEDASGALTLAADTWRRGLAGITEAEVGAGLEACIASADPWPPTLPAFRALCLRVPSLHAVRCELAKTPEGGPSPFARMVFASIDMHRMKHASADTADRILREGYESARERVLRGEPLPPAPEALIEHTEPTRTPASPETVRAHMDAIAAKLAVTDDPPDVPETGMEASL